MKKCVICKTPFTPRFSSLQKVCESPKCMIAFAEKQKKKDWEAEKKQRLEKLMTTSDWRNLLQKTFNTYIRERDKELPCISCGVNVTNGHASHFWSVGSYPNLRFDELNVHKSCEKCNTHLHGNLTEYALRLPIRIGQDKFDELSERRNKELKLSVDEIKDLIKVYREKIKELKK